MELLNGSKSVTIYYQTGWSQGVIHGSVHGGGWTDFPLKRVPSAPGKWLVGTVNCSSNGTGVAAPALEFVLNNGQSEWSKAADGGNLVVNEPGRYAVRCGTISPVVGEPVLVVSDLDGTMVGDDSATAAFKKFWEEEAVVRGGVLVYNTGRSLDSFVNLLNSKTDVLAHPDALISAVGTKVYEFTGQKWREDKGWTAVLDKDWSVDVARDAAYQALHKVGKEKMHFRPADEQNEHKITCGVHMQALESVLETVEGVLSVRSVKSNLITSGTGDWRFLDIVPIKAGKLEALNYVRRKYNFKVGSTVACGDSGNDILMLSGENPAIVVGNAQPDLVKWVDQNKAKEGGRNGKLRLLVTTQHEARGILEGLEYFGFK